MLNWAVSHFHQVNVIDVFTIRGNRACELALEVGLTLGGSVVAFFTKLINFIGVVISIFIGLFTGNAVFLDDTRLGVRKTGPIGELGIN